MASRHCPNCGIHFPPDNVFKCRICEGQTRWLPYTTVDQAWEQKVSEAEAEILPSVDDGMSLDKVGQWRFDQLLGAGYTETQALWLALDRHVDLHQAVALRRKTELAFQIVN